MLHFAKRRDDGLSHRRRIPSTEQTGRGATMLGAGIATPTWTCRGPTRPGQDLSRPGKDRRGGEIAPVGGGLGPQSTGRSLPAFRPVEGKRADGRGAQGIANLRGVEAK